MEVVGYLLEELRDAKNHALFQKDMQNANIFIGSLIFIEELAEKVRVCLVSHVLPLRGHLLCEDSANGQPETYNHNADCGDGDISAREAGRVPGVPIHARGHVRMALLCACVHA